MKTDHLIPSHWNISVAGRHFMLGEYITTLRRVISLYRDDKRYKENLRNALAERRAFLRLWSEMG